MVAAGSQLPIYFLTRKTLPLPYLKPFCNHFATFIPVIGRCVENFKADLTAMVGPRIFPDSIGIGRVACF
jgi:hypothetical protein